MRTLRKYCTKAASLIATCVLLVQALSATLRAQTATATLVVIVRANGAPVAKAEVSAGDAFATTDTTGRATLAVPVSGITVTVVKEGFLPGVTDVGVIDSSRREVTIELQRLEEQIIVTAARSHTRLEDQPLRVEVISRDEIEEKAMMTPGSVAMLVAETSGLRVQTTAPSLGAANVRIQGLRGRYSQLLADGLPLYGSQADSFSLLQVPPLDLGQVEVIKGVASALYGTSALGGVVDLVSRHPRENERQLLVNGTSQTGRDIAAWLAQAPKGRWSWTLIGSYNGQQQRDHDDDGWSDLPSFDRGTVRPRVFYDNGRGTNVFATVGAFAEDRAGGTMPGRAAPDGRPFEESLATRHIDGGAAAQWLVAGGRIVSARGSAMRQSQRRQFGEITERGTRSVWFGEGSLRGVDGPQTWVVGAAIQQDRFDSLSWPAFDYRFSSPAVFAQDEIAFGHRVALALSGRADVHSEYGVLATPRVSLLVRPAPGWIVRLAAGTGAFAPTPFTEETEETGLSRLAPLNGLRAERARGGSADLTRVVGPFELTGTLFGSIVRNPVQLRAIDATHVELVNMERPTRTWGTELIARYRAGEFTALVTHGWTRSTEIDPDRGDRREVPLTPRQAVSFTVMWEIEGGGRLGVEGYYVGRQSLEDNPFRRASRPYVLFGVMGERRWGPARLFLNAENMFDVRQTAYDPLVLPNRRADGRWSVDAWAPLEGRTINGGIRLFF
jgi:iron complex outermembrane receptor protein